MWRVTPRATLLLFAVALLICGSVSPRAGTDAVLARGLRQAAATTTAITGVRLIDGTGRPAIENAVLVVAQWPHRGRRAGGGRLGSG